MRLAFTEFKIAYLRTEYSKKIQKDYALEEAKSFRNYEEFLMELKNHINKVKDAYLFAKENNLEINEISFSDLIYLPIEKGLLIDDLDLFGEYIYGESYKLEEVFDLDITNSIENLLYKALKTCGFFSKAQFNLLIYAAYFKNKEIYKKQSISCSVEVVSNFPF